MNKWDWEWEDEEPPLFCIHEWKPVLLLRTTVYNCEKCGAKKEECEERKHSFLSRG